MMTIPAIQTRTRFCDFHKVARLARFPNSAGFAANSFTAEMTAPVGKIGWDINFVFVQFPPDPSSEPTGVRSSIDSSGGEATQSNAQSIPTFRFAPVGIDCYSLSQSAMCYVQIL